MEMEKPENHHTQSKSVKGPPNGESKLHHQTALFITGCSF